MAMDFTYDSYKSLIKKLKHCDYNFATYHNYKKFDKCVIMRHDVDETLDKALKLARLEHESEISSTYFILISSCFYNIISKDIKCKIKEILNLGHEIGLHFDETNYSKEYYYKRGGIENVVLEEVDLMKNILKCEIKSVSMHRPSKMTLEANYDFGNIVNSYGKEFFNNFKYLSDSRRHWREDVEKIILSNEYNKLHILTHAFWYNKKQQNLEQSLRQFIESATSERYELLNQNIKDLDDIFNGEKY